jgi:small subunit ribosomal protein S2
MTLTQEETKEIQKVETAESLTTEEILLLQEMAEAGLLYGLMKSKTHPKMRPYIFATRSGVEIINLESSIKSIEKATEFLKSIVASGKSVLLVGTSPAAKTVVREFAAKNGVSCISDRWLGGTLTNFKAILERIKYFNKLIADRESGALNKYTKKERVLLDKKIEKMKLLFEGISSMTELPGVVIVLDPQVNQIAVLEAKEMKIPVIGIINTDMDPAFVTCSIPGNNRLSKSIEWVLSHLEPSIKRQA